NARPARANPAKRWARHDPAQAGGTGSPLSLEEVNESCRRQAGLLAPGSAASTMLAARRPAFPGVLPSGLRERLPGYSGGTAPALDRLPSRAFRAPRRRVELLPAAPPPPPCARVKASQGAA